MTKWRALDDYSPFARLLVEHMWQQRPPLLPAQFAARMGVRKQQLSLWLNSDAVPPVPVIVRLARGLSMPVRDLLIAAGHASPEDPLFDRSGAWAYVVGELETVLAATSGDEPSTIASAELRALLAGLIAHVEDWNAPIHVAPVATVAAGAASAAPAASATSVSLEKGSEQ